MVDNSKVVALEREHFADFHEHTVRNGCIADLYRSYGDDQRLFYADDSWTLPSRYDSVYKRYFKPFYDRADRVEGCAKYWGYDYYRMQNVKDIKEVQLCHDKFCFNCQSLLALQRQAKYLPEVMSYKDQYFIAHVVFTVPNCFGENLLSTCNKMYKKFKYMMRLFSGDSKIKNLDLKGIFGYAGAVRSLEVTYNGDEDTYHPHFHCTFLFRKDFKMNKVIKNVFSFSKEHLHNDLDDGLFCSQEILLQKIWFLLWNDQKLTLPAIHAVKVGYSVKIQPMEGHEHETFKYSVKGAFKDGTIYNKYIFRTLFDALFNRHMIQGYGLLYRIKEDSSIEMELEEFYQDLIKQLQEFEQPVKCISSLSEILDEYDSGNPVCFVSKYGFRKLVIRRQIAESLEDQKDDKE
jgi:hypothetical protein